MAMLTEDEEKQKLAYERIAKLFEEAHTLLGEAEKIASEAGITVMFSFGDDAMFFKGGEGDFWTSSEWCLGN